MVSEDLPLFATMKLGGRPVKWEWTREEEFIGATTRHQMTTKVKIGAKKDGTLTALDVHVVSNTGAYGNHASETLAAAMASPFAAYRCANKKGIGHVVYTNMIPGGGFRGYGASQTTFAIECAMDELARLLGIDPFEIRRKNVVRPGDNVESIWKEPSDASFGSYGIDECLDIVERELKKGNGVAEARRRRLARGHGRGARHARMRPADRAPLGRRDEAAARRHLPSRLRLVGDGQRHHHGAQADRRLHRRRARHATSTSSMPTPTARPTTPAPSPAPARWWRARRCIITAEAMKRRHPRLRRAPHRRRPVDQCRLDNDAVICGNKRIPLTELHAEGAKVNHRFTVSRRAYLSPRTIAFNVQGVRLAVHRVTGEVRILHSVHAADIGRPINPMQCRGQLDGAVAMGYGWALIENMVHDEGHMVNPQLRNCRVPAFADTPHTDIFFADTHRHDRSAGRQVPGRVRHQSGGAGGVQRARQCHRRALRPPALHAGPAVRRRTLARAK